MADRSAWSQRVLQSRGCSIDPLFGYAPDRRFYDAILRGEAEFFEPIVRRLKASVESAGAQVIVTDPIEYFNPVHDLTNVIADMVIAELPASRPVRKLTYAIEFPSQFRREEAAFIRPLSKEEQALKQEAAGQYRPLEHEVKRLKQEGKLGYLEEELFFDDPIRNGDVEPPSQTRFRTAFYEEYGRRMVEQGRYREVLTFADHFQPLVGRLSRIHQQPA